MAPRYDAIRVQVYRANRVPDILSSLQSLIGGPRDGPLLRFGIATELLKRGLAGDAIEHLREALRREPGYSAAWKLLGKAQAQDGAIEAAKQTYRQGIAVAQDKGDLQAAKEMQVFLRRLDRA